MSSSNTADESRRLVDNIQKPSSKAKYGSVAVEERNEIIDGEDGHHHVLQIRSRDGPVTPLPKMQIAILCVMRLSEPMAFMCIMPFVPRMLKENMPEVPQEQLGYYVGFIESVFALVQFATVFLWGRASDRIGRKPVLLIGLMGTFLSTNCYGLSKTYSQMIMSRSILGLMNANIGVLKSVLGEITDETNQARAFSLIPLCFAIGSILGPTIGGKFSNPTEGFPEWFGDSAFLAKFPYWLPCFICSTFNLFGFIIGFFFLKETLPAKVRRKEAHRSRDANHDETSTSLLEGESTQEEEEDEVIVRPKLRELLTRNVVMALINSVLMNFVNICYISVLPLFLYTVVEKGGISFTKEQIGYYLAANGFITIIVQIFIFPAMERAMGGPLATLRRALTTLPLNFLCFPLAHYAAKYYGTPATVAVLCMLLAFRGSSSIMVVSSNLCIVNVVPTRAALGSINGLQQSLACLSRGIGPVFSTSLFAFSVTHTLNILDGQMVWFVFSGIALLTWFSSSQMKGANESQWRH